MLHFLIATANYADSVRVSKEVRAALAASSAQESEDYLVREFSTRDALKAYLDTHHLIGEGSTSQGENHTLVIAQPSLTDMEDLRSVLSELLAKASDSVILLRLNNAGLRGLPISSERILTNLGESALKRMTKLLERFIQDHEHFDYNKIVRLLDEYKRTRMTPLKPPGSSENDTTESPTENYAKVIAEWDKLIGDIEKSAGEALDKAIQKGERDSALLNLSSSFLHLWVEAKLYLVRARANYDVYHNAEKRLSPLQGMRRATRIPVGFGIEQRGRAEVEHAVKVIIRDYYRKLKAFDVKLRNQDFEWSYFVRRYGDAEQFRSWSKAFGSKKVKPAYEPGWDTHAASVSRRLFVEYRKALGREYWLSWRTWVSAAIFWLYWVVAGYGLEPWKPVLITALVYFGSAGAQFIDDYGTRCTGSAPAMTSASGVVKGIEYYLEVSTSNLTSLGSITPPCGEFHGLISSAESLSGYFLLAILTTLFVQSILER